MPQIHRTGKFSTISTKPTTGIVLDEDLVKKYNNEIVERAKQLKAENQDKYTNLSDEYYLNYAQKLVITQYIKQRTHFNNIQNTNYQITDPQWAGFSYEEIIEMENNGCVIPQEVLLWAHAQQEADVTNYIIVSDNTASDDETSKEDNDIKSLQKKVRQYVTQSEEAIETSEKLFEEYNKKAEKANQIKKEKEDTYKDQMGEISKLTKEWKQLDEKNKSGSLNDSEKKRYTELGKQLNGSNGTKMKEVKNTQAELEDFIDSIEGINNQVTQNNQISNDTTNAARELSKLTRNFSQFMMPHDKKETVIDNGLLSNVLQNVKGDEIAITALKTVENLDETTNNITKVFTDSDNVELAEFSNDYTDLASKTEENIQKTMGKDYDKASEENDDKEEKENNAKEHMKNKDKYSVAKVFSFANSIAATETTNKSVAELLADKRKAQNDEKQLKKAVKDSEKDIKELDKETSKIEKRKEEKVQEEELFLEKLDALNNKREVKPTEKQEEQVQTKETGEKDSIVSEIEETKSGDKELTKGLGKILDKSNTSTKKSSKLAKILRGETQELVKLNNNTKKVASDTIFVGAGTSAQSIMTGTIGYGLVEVGTFMMGSIFPPTVAAGTKMVIAGMIFLNIAQLELATGTTAIATGANALEISKEAKDTANNTKDSEKDANQTVKENNAQMKESTQNAKGEDNKTSAATEQSDSAEPATNEEGVSATEEQPTTEETKESETNTKNKEEEQQQEKQESSSYSVDLKFGYKNAQKTTQTTQGSTSEVLQTKSDTTSADVDLTKKVKNIEKLTKQNEKAEKQAEIIHKKFTQKTQQAILKIEESDSNIKSGLEEGNEEKVTASQIDIENHTSALESVTKEETVSITSLSKNIASLTSNLKTSQKDAQNLNSDIKEYDKLLKNQLEVSAKTTIVGGGTIRKGVLEENEGIQQVTTGSSLLPSPLTHVEGVIMIAKGTKNIIEGITDMAFGTEAAVNGIIGIAENISATKNKDSIDKNTQKSIAQINTDNKTTQDSAKKIKAIESEAKTYSEEITSISASASSNANTTDNTKTDDKEDRRLTRFNEDSMIESKKKRKKVMAVSASSKG